MNLRTGKDMDEKIEAVLREYHARLAQERQNREAGLIALGSEEWRDQTLLAVGPDTGQLLNILARGLQAPNILELGTSFGYSGIWLAEAARATGGRLITMEQRAHKSTYARAMSEKAGLADYVDFQLGDALELIDKLPFGIDFVLVDLWKDLYVPCLERFYPKLNPGAIIVADNMIRGTEPTRENAKRYRDAVRAKPGITSVLLPVGSGIEVSRYAP